MAQRSIISMRKSDLFENNTFPNFLEMHDNDSNNKPLFFSISLDLEAFQTESEYGDVRDRYTAM